MIKISMHTLLVPLCLFMVGCTSQTADQAVDGAADPLDPSIEPEVSLFPEDLAQDIDYLQLAIDLQLEDLIAACMASDGFRYESLTVEEIQFKYGAIDAAYVTTNSAKLALESVFVPSSQYDVSPSNQESVSGFSEQEVTRWQTALQDCRVSESNRQAPPWESLNTDWYLGLQRDASSLAAADSRYIEAETASKTCLRETGFGNDLESIVGESDEATGTIVTSYFNGDLTEADAREQLEDLASSQQTIIDAIQRCEQPRIEVQRRLYVYYLNEIGLEEDVRLAEWVESTRKELAKYREQLDELIEG